MSPEKQLHYKATAFGFEWGPAVVERLASDPQGRWVVIAVKAGEEWIQVYTTETGKMQVFSPDGEWQEPVANSGSPQAIGARLMESLVRRLRALTKLEKE